MGLWICSYVATQMLANGQQSIVNGLARVEAGSEGQAEEMTRVIARGFLSRERDYRLLAVTCVLDDELGVVEDPENVREVRLPDLYVEGL
jgi:hypothetical protein